MKRFIIVLMASVMALCACNKQQDPYVLCYGTATMKPYNDGTFYFKLTEDVALLPKVQSSYPFEQKEKRVIMTYADFGTSTTSKVPGFTYTDIIEVQAIDTVLTKNPVPHTSDDAKAYGNDKLGVYLGESVFPTTMIEDGYLCVSFNFAYSDPDKTKTINLVYGANPNDPYEVFLRYNAAGDDPMYSSDGYVNFPLKCLPDTGGQTVKLTLKWNSSVTGETNSQTFDYCSRTDW